MRVGPLVASRPSPPVSSLVVVAAVLLTLGAACLAPPAGAGGRRSPEFPVPVLAPVLSLDAPPELDLVAVYRDAASLEAEDPTIVTEFAERFDLPESDYRISVYVGDPSGEQTRASLIAEGGDVGIVERSAGDGTFADAGATEARFDRLTAAITIPADLVPASGSLWVEVEAGGNVIGTPLFPLTQVLQTGPRGVLTASDVVLLADGPADLTASPTLEIAEDRLTVTYTEAPPTEVGGNPLQSVVDVVRVVPSFDDAGQARYQIAIDNAAGTVVLFDNQTGFPVAVEADPATWLIRGLDGAPATAGTVVEVDLDGLFAAFGFSPDGGSTAIGLARSLTIDASQAVRADGALATLDWFEVDATVGATGSGAEGAADGGTAAATEAESGAEPSSDSSDSFLPLALAIVAIVVVAGVAWLLVRRGSGGDDTTSLRITSGGDEPTPTDVSITPAEQAEIEELTAGLFGDESPSGAR